MQNIVIASYLTAAAAFAVATALLALAWRGHRTGALLVLATTVSLLWAGLLAGAAWWQDITINWVLLADVLRYGAWLAFVGALFANWPTTGLLRGLRVVAHAVWIVLALYCALPATPLARAIGVPFSVGVPFVGVLMLALIGLMFLEQIYRNVEREQRWALKFLVIGLGAMFAYDIFLYSYAVLYRQFDAGTWAARGFVDALVVPLLLVAAARNREWSLDVGVSRRAVFYSSSLMVVALYIVATALGGYYVRAYGGDLGKVAGIALVCFALLLVILVASSGQARSRLKVFLHKNFFSFRHDYREEWLRLTATLGASDSDTELPQRAVRALAQTMDSPAGALFLLDDADAFVSVAGWNLAVPPTLRLAATHPAFACMRERRWIYDLTDPPPLGKAALAAPAELTALPQAWLLVPLVLEQRLLGFALLAQARARRALDWEDIDLLRTAGSQVAGTLAQAANARRLAEARQFEGFNRLTAFLMHDLKNIAAQQSLLLQNAVRHKTNPAFIDDMLKTVENSVHRITRVLEQLRGEVAATKAGRVRLAAVVQRAIEECGAQAPEPVCEMAPDEAWVRADVEQFGTVLAHVIRNAQDAAGAAGHVTVRTTITGDRAMITIEDDGQGMDAEFIRNRLFKPFFTTKASKGMGIGAYQAREYVRSLGGTLRVHSTPGQGSVFTLDVPMAATNADGVAKPELNPGTAA